MKDGVGIEWAESVACDESGWGRALREELA